MRPKHRLLPTSSGDTAVALPRPHSSNVSQSDQLRLTGHAWYLTRDLAGKFWTGKTVKIILPRFLCLKFLNNLWLQFPRLD